GGDTAAVPFGIGTFASRSAVTAGNSIADACHEVRARLVRAAATLLEAAPEDIDLEDGRAFVRGSPQRAFDLARVVQASIPTFAGPGIASADFEASAYHHVPTGTYASAVHVAQVEADVETGGVRPLASGGGQGLGEGGASSPPAAIANAIEDALAPFGVRVTETPVTPARILARLAAERA